MTTNTVPNAPNADLHNEAVKLMQRMLPHGKAETDALVTVKSYNQRRKEATKALHPVLVKINDCFKRHETVGGCGAMREWCEQVGTLTYARVRQIITGKSGNEKKVKSVDSLDPIDLTTGTAVRVGDRVLYLTTTPKLHPATPGVFTLTVVVEEKTPTVTKHIPDNSHPYAPCKCTPCKAAAKVRLAPAPETRTRKLTQRETKTAIFEWEKSETGKDDGTTTAWAAKVASFDAAVKPEWHSAPVRRQREMLQHILHARENEELNPDKALAATLSALDDGCQAGGAV
jgi:hypothetical protein